MAANAFQSSTPMKTPNPKNHSSASRRAPPPNQMDSSVSAVADFKSRFEAYNRLQAAAVAFGERLPIPEIVALGGQSDGKSSLLEALLGFRFNVREVEMGTRRPLVLQMVHDPSALEPRCRFQVIYPNLYVTLWGFVPSPLDFSIDFYKLGILTRHRFLFSVKISA